ncbi:unnamed protein product [Hermetia illucens]|uniref:Uncharacterized protein n=1 Tax=Hermetia illucens TaxID=343691 RepID=A0A7R8UBD7_HERIL|nr:unnamed protein product [Hermetia illucens]
MSLVDITANFHILLKGLQYLEILFSFLSYNTTSFELLETPESNEDEICNEGLAAALLPTIKANGDIADEDAALENNPSIEYHFTFRDLRKCH